MNWYDNEREKIENESNPVVLLRMIAKYLLMMIQDADERHREMRGSL